MTNTKVVKEGVAISNSLGKILNEILEMLSNIGLEVFNINSLANLQAEKAYEIVQAVYETAEISQENSGPAEQVLNATLQSDQ